MPSGDPEKDKNLPGMSGVFNSFNLNLNAYGHQNPVKFVDPDGRVVLQAFAFFAAVATRVMLWVAPRQAAITTAVETGAAITTGAAIPSVAVEVAAAKVASVATGGRLGNQATRAHVGQVATEMESRGWKITHGGGRGPEEYLAGSGGGRKGSSFPDITATKNANTLRVNTVDTYANGVTPTKREAANAARIRSQTGEHVLLLPKPE